MRARLASSFMLTLLLLAGSAHAQQSIEQLLGTELLKNTRITGEGFAFELDDARGCKLNLHRSDTPFVWDGGCEDGFAQGPGRLVIRNGDTATYAVDYGASAGVRVENGYLYRNIPWDRISYSLTRCELYSYTKSGIVHVEVRFPSELETATVYVTNPILSAVKSLVEAEPCVREAPANIIWTYHVNATSHDQREQFKAGFAPGRDAGWTFAYNSEREETIRSLGEINVSALVREVMQNIAGTEPKRFDPSLDWRQFLVLAGSLGITSNQLLGHIPDGMWSTNPFEDRDAKKAEITEIEIEAGRTFVPTIEVPFVQPAPSYDFNTKSFPIQLPRRLDVMNDRPDGVFTVIDFEIDMMRFMLGTTWDKPIQNPWAIENRFGSNMVEGTGLFLFRLENEILARHIYDALHEGVGKVAVIARCRGQDSTFDEGAMTLLRLSCHPFEYELVNLTSGTTVVTWSLVDDRWSMQTSLQ